MFVQDRSDSTPTIQSTLVLVEGSGRLDGQVPGREGETNVEAGDNSQREDDEKGKGDAGNARHCSTPSIGSVIRPT